MRWTDLPPDGGGDDAGPSGLRRGEWERLRARLERLPPGHPSSPGHERQAGETGEDDAWGDGPDPDAQAAWEAGRERARGQAGERPSGAGDPEKAHRRGGAERHSRQGRTDKTARRGGHDEGARGGAGGATDAMGAGPAHGEPYRPWFASGESAEPWFASDAGPGLIPPSRDRG